MNGKKVSNGHTRDRSRSQDIDAMINQQKHLIDVNEEALKDHGSRTPNCQSDSLETSFDDSYLFTKPTLRKYKQHEYLVRLWLLKTRSTLLFNFGMAVAWVLIDVLFFFLSRREAAQDQNVSH